MVFGQKTEKNRNITPKNDKRFGFFKIEITVRKLAVIFFWGTIYLMAQKEIAILLPLSKKMFLFVPTGK